MGTNVERNVVATTMKFVTSTLGAYKMVSYIWGYTQFYYSFVLFLFGACWTADIYVGTQEFISYVINLCQNNLQRGLTETTLYPLNYLFILSFIIIYQNIRFLS